MTRHKTTEKYGQYGQNQQKAHDNMYRYLRHTTLAVHGPWADPEVKETSPESTVAWAGTFPEGILRSAWHGLHPGARPSSGAARWNAKNASPICGSQTCGRCCGRGRPRSRSVGYAAVLSVWYRFGRIIGRHRIRIVEAGPSGGLDRTAQQRIVRRVHPGLQTFSHFLQRA